MALYEQCLYDADGQPLTALLDRLLHHAHVLTCGPRSWRTRLHGERAASGA